jgi:hypothetical protein
MHDHPGEEFDGRKVFGEALKGIEDYVEVRWGTVGEAVGLSVWADFRGGVYLHAG